MSAVTQPQETQPQATHGQLRCVCGVEFICELRARVFCPSCYSLWQTGDALEPALLLTPGGVDGHLPVWGPR